MVKTTETAAKLPEEVIAEVNAMPESVAETIAIQSRRSGKGFFETEIATVTEAFRNKAQIIGDARQKLAKAAENATDSENLAGEALEASQEGAATLYQAWRNGVIDKPELTALLGDIFGWRMKGDSKTRVTTGDKDQSATPYGTGEVIRKRIVRAHDALDYVTSNGNEGTAFFEPLDVDDVAGTLNEFHDGKMSVFTLYDKLSTMKADATGTRPKAAFDPKRIAALAKQMGENVNATADAVLSNNGLRAAYLSLFQILQTVSGVAADKLDEKDAA